MKKYSFGNVSNIYVMGGLHGDLKKYLHEIKSKLYVKDDDVEQPHPMEIERKARINARNNAIRNRIMPHLNNGPFEMYRSAFNDSIFGKTKKLNKGKFSLYTNSLLIISGDCGIGFNRPNYYTELLEPYNKILEYNNSFLIFVRGNHDDPDFFDGEKINFSNIKAVSDYSVIEANKKNILCVGGAISTDRIWRKKQEDRINSFSLPYKKKLYWDGEAPVFDADALNDIVKNTKIDYVVSHSAPSFVSPENCSTVEEWANEDTTLIDEVKNERITLDKIFNMLRDNGTKPYYWAYSHFNLSFLEKRSDTLFRALGNGLNSIPIELEILRFEENEKNNKLKEKEKRSSLSSRFKLQEANTGEWLIADNDLEAPTLDENVGENEFGVDEADRVETDDAAELTEAITTNAVNYNAAHLEELTGRLNDMLTTTTIEYTAVPQTFYATNNISEIYGRTQ